MALGTNIVTNPGFETGAVGSTPTGWSNDAACIISNTYKHAGSNSMIIPAGKYAGVNNILSAAGLVAGRNATFSLWVMDHAVAVAWAAGDSTKYATGDIVLGSNGFEYQCVQSAGSGTYDPVTSNGYTSWRIRRITIEVKGYGSAGRKDYLGEFIYRVPACTTTDAWQQFTFNHVIPCDWAGFDLYMESNYTVKSLWIDDVSVSMDDTNRLIARLSTPASNPMTPNMGNTATISYETQTTEALKAVGATRVKVVVGSLAPVYKLTDTEYGGNQSIDVDVSSLGAGTYAVTATQELTASPYTVYNTVVLSLTKSATNKSVSDNPYVDSQRRLVVNGVPIVPKIAYSSQTILKLKNNEAIGSTSIETDTPTTSFPASGTLMIDGELITYSNNDTTNKIFTCTATTKAHTAGALIYVGDFMSNLVATGFNCIIDYTQGVDSGWGYMEVLDKHISDFYAAGIYTILNLLDVRVGGTYCGKWNEHGYTDAAGALASLAYLWNRYKDNPAVIGCYLFDEIDLESTNSITSELEIYSAYIRSVSDKPIFSVNYPGNNSLKAYDLADCVSIDEYPIYRGSTRYSVVKDAWRLANESLGHGLIYMTLEAGSENADITTAPTTNAIICDMYSAICNGCKGFAFYTVGNDSATTTATGITKDKATQWGIVTRAIKNHLTSIDSIILGEDADTQITVTEGIETITRIVGEDYYVLACNPTTAAIAATFTIPSPLSFVKIRKGLPGGFSQNVHQIVTDKWKATLEAGEVACYRLYNTRLHAVRS